MAPGTWGYRTDRAYRCHEFLRELGGTDNTQPQGDVSGSGDPNVTT